MSAPASESRRCGPVATWLAAGVLAWCCGVAAQTPSAPAAIDAADDGRRIIQILVEDLGVHLEPLAGSPVFALLQPGTRVAADARRGAWFQVILSDGRKGWIEYVAGKASPDFSVGTAAGVVLDVPRPLSTVAPTPKEELAPGVA